MDNAIILVCGILDLEYKNQILNCKKNNKKENVGLGNELLNVMRLDHQICYCKS